MAIKNPLSVLKIGGRSFKRGKGESQSQFFKRSKTGKAFDPSSILSSQERAQEFARVQQDQRDAGLGELSSAQRKFVFSEFGGKTTQVARGTPRTVNRKLQQFRSGVTTGKDIRTVQEQARQQGKSVQQVQRERGFAPTGKREVSTDETNLGRLRDLKGKATTKEEKDRLAKLIRIKNKEVNEARKKEIRAAAAGRVGSAGDVASSAVETIDREIESLDRSNFEEGPQGDIDFERTKNALLSERIDAGVEGLAGKGAETQQARTLEGEAPSPFDFDIGIEETLFEKQLEREFEERFGEQVKERRTRVEEKFETERERIEFEQEEDLAREQERVRLEGLSTAAAGGAFFGEAGGALTSNAELIQSIRNEGAKGLLRLKRDQRIELSDVINRQDEILLQLTEAEKSEFFDFRDREIESVRQANAARATAIKDQRNFERQQRLDELTFAKFDLDTAKFFQTAQIQQNVEDRAQREFKSKETQRTFDNIAKKFNIQKSFLDVAQDRFGDGALSDALLTQMFADQGIDIPQEMLDITSPEEFEDKLNLLSKFSKIDPAFIGMLGEIKNAELGIRENITIDEITKTARDAQRQGIFDVALGRAAAEAQVAAGQLFFDVGAGGFPVQKATTPSTATVSFSEAGSAPAKGFRTDRHNNPAAFTTDIARQAGLVEGVDFTVGDAFPNNPNLTTARLIGDPIEQTIKVIDEIGFFTQAGQQRWTHTAIPENEWNAMDDEQKGQIVASMYSKEGGTGSLLNKSPVTQTPESKTSFSGSGAVALSTGQQGQKDTDLIRLGAGELSGTNFEDAQKRAFLLGYTQEFNQALSAGLGDEVTGKPKTAAQSKSFGFARRMNESGDILNNLESEVSQLSAAELLFQRALPNIAKTDLMQRQEQAERDFVNSILRQESGAAIAESEFKSAQKQYFIQAGDSPGVIDQKRRNRQNALEGMFLASGEDITAAVTPLSGQTIEVINKDGVKGVIPIEDLQEALRTDFTISGQ